MGIAVHVEEEDGARLTVPTPLDRENERFSVGDLLTSVDETFACLRFLDRHGRTVFNHAQVRVLLSEFERLSDRASGTQRGTLAEVEAHAHFALALPHRYLVFDGD